MSLAAKFNRKKKVEKAAQGPKKRPYNKHVNTVEKILKNIENFIADQNLSLAEIKSISFSVFEKEILKRQSVCKVSNINGSVDTTGSLEDPRMGTIENYQLCTTCEKTNDECTGHLAMMDLPVNIIHPFYRSTVVQVLNCICHTCNKLLISETIISEKGINLLKGSKRLKAITEASQKIKECNNPNCAMQPVFKDKKPSETNIWPRDLPYFIKKNKREKDLFMSVDTIKKKLDCISDKDAKTLGFDINHPRNFIVDYIPVIPLNDRPYNETGTKDRKDHPLTFAYKDILLKNLESLQYDDKDEKEDCYSNILKFYSYLIKNSSGEYTLAQKEPIKSITDLITHKDGLIRGNLMGKRCDYTGRTVLGPNKNIKFGYLAVPEGMKNLTMPETITIYNMNKIIKLAKEGKIKYFCPRNGNLAGRKLKFDINKHIDKLRIGDRVDRNSEDDDYFIFNRQPTLHRYSMLGYRAKFQDKMTIGVHLSSTEGHNADFDGDEGNLHLVQTTSAQTEARLLMTPIYCMINSAGSNPSASLIYNSITGAYLMTHQNKPMSAKIFNEGVEHIREQMGEEYVNTNLSNLDKRLGNIDKYSYYGLCSILFPPDFWFMNRTCHISEGVLRYGSISKACKGSHNGIIQNIYKNYNKQAAADFISAANFLFNWFLTKQGFSLSIEDILITSKEKESYFYDERDKYIDIMNKELINLPILDDDADKYKIEEREQYISKLTHNTSIKIGKFFIDEILDKERNSINIMSKETSGAKGEKTKLLSVVSSLGQIFVNQKLPAKTINKKRRWLTSFSVYDTSAESTGFSKNSFFEGIDPNAYFANAQDGRRGMIDTAVNTRSTGYLERSMVKSQEDLIMNYDGSIRNQTNIIFQYSYGPGFNPMDMVKDDTENDFEVFSFINIKELCGTINSQNGFHDFDLSGKIRNIIEGINEKYGEQIEVKEPSSDFDVGVEEYHHGIEEDYLDFDVEE